MKKKDVLNFLEVGTHLGGTNLEFQAEQAVRESENLADGSVTISRTTDQEAVLKFAAATDWSHSHCQQLHLWASTNRTQAAFPDPRLDLRLPTPADSTAIRHVQGAPSALARPRRLAGEVLRMCALSGGNTHGRWGASSLLQSLKRLEKKGGCCQKGHKTRRSLREGAAPAPECTAPQPEVVHESEGAQVLSGPIRLLPAED
nr:40S ribosomal protein SA-like [Vicugna pacos]